MALAEEFVQLTPETAGFKAKAEAEIGDIDVKAKVHPDVDKNVFQKAGADGGTAASETFAKAWAAGLKANAGKAGFLDDEVKRLKTSVLELSKEFERTGDIDLFKKIGDQQSALRKLEGVRKTIESEFKKGSGDGVEDGIKDGGERGLRSLGPIAASNPYIASGIAIAIAAGTPAIAGALAGAVAGGGIAAGVLLASKDERTKAAWSQVGEVAQRQLTEAATPFVSVLVHGAQTAQDTFEKIMPSIRRDFAELAPVADRLFTGAAGFVERLMPGIDALVREGSPVLDMLSRELPRLGAAISTAFSSIVSAGEGGKAALQDMLRVAEGSIIVFGKLVEITERVYAADRALVQQLFARDSQGAINSMAAALTTTKDANVSLTDSIHAAAEAARGQNLAYAGIAERLRDTQAAAAALRAEIDRITNSSLGLAGANLQLSTDEAGLTAAIREHGAALAGNSANALANQQTILGLARDLESVRKAELAHGASLDEANAHLEANAGKLYDMAAAAGFDRGQVQSLIESMLAIPDVRRTITIDEIRTHTDVYRVIDQTGNIVGGSPYLKSASQLGLRALGGIVKAAEGMIVNSPTIMFGEGRGREAYIPENGSDSRALGYADMAARWHGGRVVPDRWGSDGSMRLDDYTIRRLGTVIGETVAAGIGTAISTSSKASARYGDLLARGG